MKTRMTRYLLTAAGVVGLAGTPALFAGDYYGNYDHHYEYRSLDRENARIRHDERRLHEDLEHRRYRKAERDRARLERDRYRRNREFRNGYRDERYGWR